MDDGNTQTDTMALERQRGITMTNSARWCVVRRRRPHREPDRHARPPGFHRGSRADPGHLLGRRGAGDLRGRGRAGADPGADVALQAAGPPDAHLRQRDRPARRPGRAGAGGDPREADPRDRLDGDGPGPRHPPRHLASLHDVTGDAAFAARLADVLADHDDGFLAACLDDRRRPSPTASWQAFATAGPSAAVRSSTMSGRPVCGQEPVRRSRPAPRPARPRRPPSSRPRG